MTLLELENIKKYFIVRKKFLGGEKSVVKAVDGVSLSIQEGESLALVGESGCGKTTLARIILRLVDPDGGKIILYGNDITVLSARALKPLRKHMQIVFQDPQSSLDPRFTVRSILEEGMTLDGKKDKSQREDRIYQLLSAVQLKGDILNRYPHEFSGGERQRIAIARALVLNPKLLVLDEAVSSLDAFVQEEIIQLLKDLQKRFHLTYLFITHNLRVVKKVADRIAVMYKGKIVELAPRDELLQNPLHPYTKELLSAAIHYKNIHREEDIALDSSAQFVEQNPGHFVLGDKS